MCPPPAERVTESLRFASSLRRALRRLAITADAPRELPYHKIRNSSLAPRPLLRVNTGHAHAIPTLP